MIAVTKVHNKVNSGVKHTFLYLYVHFFMFSTFYFLRVKELDQN